MCRFEFDFAAHRAFGDGGDVRLQAGEVGQFIESFLAGHRGIHVGEKKLLAPERGRLHDNVDRQVAVCSGLVIAEVLAACEDVDGDLVEQPLRRAGRGQDGQHAIDDGGIERGVGGIADERGDEDVQAGSRLVDKAVLIAGPTASGKSALALELAQGPAGSSSTPTPCRSIATSAS